MLLRSEAEDRRAQQRTLAQVERSLRLLSRLPRGFGLAFRLRQRREVHDAHAKGESRCDHLARLARRGGEGRPERLVAPDDLCQAPFERRHLQPSGEPERGRDIFLLRDREPYARSPTPL